MASATRPVPEPSCVASEEVVLLLMGRLGLLAGRDHPPHELREVDAAAGALRLPLLLLLLD